MQFAKHSDHLAFEHKAGAPAWMQPFVVFEAPVLQAQTQLSHCASQHAPTLVIGQGRRLAAGAPQTLAPLTGKNSTQPLLFAELLAITGKHLANLKSPEARLAGLQIPASGLEQSWDSCSSQAAVVGE